MRKQNWIIMAALWFLAMAAAVAGAEDVTAAAGADSLDAASRGNTVFLPVLGYTPDTGLMLGAVALKFFYLDPPGQDTRPSVFSPTFIYTLKSQTLVFLGTDFYWDDASNHAGFSPSYIKFPDNFYGLGRDVSLDDEEDYTPEQVALEAAFDRRLWSQLRLGLTQALILHRLVKIDPGGRLASGSVRGIENATVSGPGLSAAWDTRDHTWAPARGLWLQVNGRWARRDFGSDFEFNEYAADLRGYVPLSEKTVLAGQVMGVRLEHDVPFFVLPKLGGESGLRGYRGGLYRDRVMALGRAEIRRDRIWRRFGGVVFAGIGDVAPSPGKLTLARNLWTAGFGLRYTLDKVESVKIRLDLGWGNGDSGFYLSLGEAF
jgi:outer membrane protein assembly factor BamA